MTPSSIHDRALHWFARLSDADAPESAWIEFQAWLEADARHAAAYDQVERLWVALDSPVDEPAAAIIIAPIAANDAAPRHRRAPSGWRWAAPLMATAAACVMVVGLWPEISGQGRFRSYTTEDAQREVVLADGTQVAMNRHSDLRVRIGSKRRDVVLTGEAAFDVAHDADRPFVIAADDHEVRVLGTAFDVLNHGELFSVAVSRGLVAVSGGGLPAPMELAAGQRMSQSGSAAAMVSAIAPDQTDGWRQGVLVYRGADLGAVANDLSRYLDKPVSVSASARALRFTGALRIGDEATMLRQLQDFVPIRVTRANDGIQLTTRDDA